MKAWLLQWLGVSALVKEISEILDLQQAQIVKLHSECETLRTVHNDLVATSEKTIAELIQELNTLRNSIPAAVAQQTKPTTRVFRNFREFRDAVEGAPARILIERKSS